MQTFRILIVHSSDELAADLIDQLDARGVPADHAATASEANALLSVNHYGVVLLEDALPHSGSVRVFETLHRPDITRPDAVIVTVPRELVAEAQEFGRDEVEYMATPSDDAEKQSLARVIRKRLMTRELTDDMRAKYEHPTLRAQLNASRRSLSRESDRKPVMALVAVVAVLVVLLIILQASTNPNTAGPVGFAPGHRFDGNASGPVQVLLDSGRTR